MFTVSVRGRAFIAHSFKGAEFGPAQALHGATFVVDAKFQSQQLHSSGFVIDVCLAEKLLGDSLKRYNYKNLDEPEFKEFKGAITSADVEIIVLLL